MSSPPRAPGPVLAVLGPLMILAGLLPALPAAAGHVYHLSRETQLLRGPASEVAHQESDGGVLSIAGSKVRFDQGQQVSWILDAARSELILVRHDRRLYHVLPVPLELEDFARTPEEKALLEERKKSSMVGIEVVPRGEQRRIGDYEASRVDVGGRSPDGTSSVRYELWQSAAMPGDEGLYRAILREFGSADLVLRPLVRKLAEVPGFPVLRRSVLVFPDGRSTDERKLVSIEEKDLPDSLFAPPAGYRNQPFDLMDWLTPR